MPNKNKVIRQGLSCAFSGHRPHYFSFGFDEKHLDCMRLKLLLFNQINVLIDHGVTQFFCGMAQGVDTWAAEMVLEIKKQKPAIQLFCVLPCESQPDKWEKKNRERYFNLLAKADQIIYVNRRYTKTCMLKRNRFLVDQADFVLAICNGEYRSGTAATLRYAKKQKRILIVINLKAEINTPLTLFQLVNENTVRLY